MLKGDGIMHKKIFETHHVPDHKAIRYCLTMTSDEINTYNTACMKLEKEYLNGCNSPHMPLKEYAAVAEDNLMRYHHLCSTFPIINNVIRYGEIKKFYGHIYDTVTDPEEIADIVTKHAPHTYTDKKFIVRGILFAREHYAKLCEVVDTHGSDYADNLFKPLQKSFFATLLRYPFSAKEFVSLHKKADLHAPYTQLGYKAMMLYSDYTEKGLPQVAIAQTFFLAHSELV